MVIGGLDAAARFLPRAWRAAWGGLILASAAIALALAHGSLAVWFAALTMVLIARGGLWRLASGAKPVGPAGLQFGVIEARLAGVWLLSALFLGVLLLLAFVLLLCGAYAAASAGRGFDPANVASWVPAIVGGGRVLLGAIAGLCAAGIVFVAVRISLAEAATVHRSKIQVLAAFALSRGRTLALAAAYVIVAAPVIILAAWCMIHGYTNVWAAAEGLAVGGLWLPTSVGLMAYGFDLCARPT